MPLAGSFWPMAFPAAFMKNILAKKNAAKKPAATDASESMSEDMSAEDATASASSDQADSSDAPAFLKKTDNKNPLKKWADKALRK
jgi:hypothetical protein